MLFLCVCVVCLRVLVEWSFPPVARTYARNCQPIKSGCTCVLPWWDLMCKLCNERVTLSLWLNGFCLCKSHAIVFYVFLLMPWFSPMITGQGGVPPSSFCFEFFR